MQKIPAAGSTGEKLVLLILSKGQIRINKRKPEASAFFAVKRFWLNAQVLTACILATMVNRSGMGMQGKGGV